MKKRRFITILAAALFLTVLSFSCSDKENEDTLPELPPIDAMLMDFDEFIDNPSQMPALKSMEGYENARFSFLTVSFWSVLVNLPMIVPAAAYLESFNHTPVYLGDNSWQWSYSVTGVTDSYSARLVTKRISNDEFTAEMIVSKTGGFQDFKWFEGSIRYDRTHAEWTMYDSPINNVAWLDIEWNKDWELNTSNITYTIVQPGHEQEGSYITFGITEDSVYDAYYTISMSEKETMIKWNRTLSNGKVMDEVYFGDNLWHCWNELLLDADCN